MKKLEDILKTLAGGMVLSENEKREMRERIESYARFHSVRKESPERLHTQRPHFSTPSLLLALRKKIMPIVLILALLFGGGGVSYAAEGAVPGDALYPIKVSVNEEVRDIVALTPEAKADWATRLVERRLEEAEKIAQETGEISPAAQTVIEEKIEKHIEKIELHLTRVEEKKNVAGASEISAKLETTLRSHVAVLEKVKEKQAQKIALTAAAPADASAAENALVATKEFREDRLASLTEKLTQSAEKIAVRREAHLETLAFEDAPEREEAAQNQKRVAEKKIAEFTRIFEENGGEIADAVKARLEEGIAQMKEAFRKGEEALLNEAFGEAFVYFQEAGAMAQKLTIFMRSEQKHDIDASGGASAKPLIRPAVSVTARPDTGVPADDATRKDLAEAMLRKASIYLDETKKLFEEHQAKLPDDIAKRIRVNIGTAEELIGEGKRAFDAGEYGSAYLAGQKAINLLSELQQVIRKYASSSNDDTVNAEVRRAHEAAANALLKAKQAISSSSASDDVIHKAKALYEEAHAAFSSGERAMKAGTPKEAVEFFHKTVRIVEEIMRVLGGTVSIKPYPIEPTPTPVPKPIPEPIACTKEYAPVCASVKTGIVCVTTPCPTTIEKTYGNACEARVAGAAVVYKGECRPSETGTVKPSLGAIETEAKTAVPVTGAVEIKTDEAVKADSLNTTNTTEVKAEEIKTDSTRYYSY